MHAPLLFEPARELRVRQRVKKAHHADRDSGFLNQLDHRIRRRLRFAVETDDETCVHEKAGRVDSAETVRDTASRILLLAHRNEGRGVRALDADKNPDEVGPVQQHQEFVIVGEIERGFRRELERIVVRFQPLGEVGKEGLHGLLVADQVVVHEIDVAAITETIELIEFR